MLAGVLSHGHGGQEQRPVGRGKSHTAAALLGILYEHFSLPQLTLPGALVVVLLCLEGSLNTSPFR